jgi:NAD(P)-dependent dehydrogenase (short-subunit alcohol dehydrogenase family)
MIGWISALALAAAATDIPPPPADPRLEAFRAACVPHRQDLAKAAEALAADGWTRVADDDHPQLAAAMAVARERGEDAELQMTTDYSVWGRTRDGLRLHVVLSRMDAVIGETEDSDGDGVLQDWEKARPWVMLGCGLWDFEATGQIDHAAMNAWVGAGPVQVIDAPGQISGGTWNVFEIMPGTAEVHMGFIPPGGGMGIAPGFWGLSITMSSALPEDPAEAESRAD